MTADLYGTNEKATAFMDDIVAVCKKHGLSISHEDGHGGFLIVPLDERCVQWFLEAAGENL